MAIDTETLQWLAEAKHKAALNFDLAIIAALGGSAADVLANLGSATEMSAIAIPETQQVGQEEVLRDYPQKYTDVADVESLYSEGLMVTVEHFPGAVALTFIDMGLNHIPSSQVSAFAAEVKLHPKQFAPMARIYVRFKGGGLYRYFPLRTGMLASMVGIARRMSQGQKVETTIGEYMNRVIKQACEGLDPLAICEKFDPTSNTWNLTLSKSQKDEAKAEGSGDRVWARATKFAREVHANTDDVVEHPIQAPSSGTEVEPVPAPEQPLDLPIAENVPTEVPTQEQVLEVDTPESLPAPQAAETQNVEGIGANAVF